MDVQSLSVSREVGEGEMQAMLDAATQQVVLEQALAKPAQFSKRPGKGSGRGKRGRRSKQEIRKLQQVYTVLYYKDIAVDS